MKRLVSGMEQSSARILLCDCECFKKEEFNYPDDYDYNSSEHHIKFWRKYLELVTIEICNHRLKSIFNLPCGDKTHVSAGVYESSLNHALESLELLDKKVKELNAEDEIVYLNIKFSPLPKKSFIALVRNFLLMEKHLLQYSCPNDDTFTFEYYSRYFSIHKNILSILDKTTFKNERQSLEALVSELASYVATSF